MPDVYAPKSYEIKRIQLFPVGDPQGWDIRFMFVEMNIYEQLFSNGMSGSMVISDATNMIHNMPIFGFETIEIVFSTPDREDFTHTFRIYKIENKALVNEREQIYMLHLISGELFQDRLTRVSKSYNGKLISDIVQDLQENYLASFFTNLEPTKYMHQIVIPNLNPMEAIRWLSVRSNSASFPGSNYVYYENKAGYNFVSIESLVQNGNPAVQTYHVRPSNLRLPRAGNPGHESSDDKEIEVGVDDYVFKNHIDTLESVMMGMYGNRLITHNIIRKRFFTADFSYTDTYPQYHHLEQNTATNELKKFSGKTFLSDQAGSLNGPNALYKLFPSGQQSEDYPNQVENWIQERISRLQQIHNIEVDVTVPGDSRRKIGDVVKFMLPSPEQMKSNQLQMDIFYQGRYLITSLRHIINKHEYVCKMTLTKDSVFEPHP